MILPLNAKDSATLVVKLDFTDESGVAVIPASASWTLLDNDNAVVNSRQDVAISSPAATTYLQLDPADLAYSDGDSRTLVVTWTYLSSLTGLTATDRSSATINIEDIPEPA